MNQKEPQSDGQIRDYVSCILKSSVGRHSGKLLLYADGLAMCKKKGVTAMIRDLNGRHSTSTVIRSLKRGHTELYTAKEERIERDSIDKRKRYFFVLDDTPVRRYGRSIHGAGYNHDDSTGGIIWGNCLVTFQLAVKKGRWTTISDSTSARDTQGSTGCPSGGRPS